MGFFSFKTQDTNRSIANIHSSMETMKVVLMDNKGNTWTEHEYNGYGEFGGKDYYELVAEMNGKSTRDEGIKISFSKGDWIFPNIVEDADEWTWRNEQPSRCEYQGFFYSMWI